MLRQIFRVFIVLVVFMGFISYMVSPMIAGWTNETDFATKITGPKVCPTDTTVRIDVVESIGNGTSYKTVTDHFDCVNSNGDIVANKTTEQENLWKWLLQISDITLVALASLLIAIPIGIISTRKGMSI